MPERQQAAEPGSALTPEERVTEEIISCSNWEMVVKKVHAAIRAAVAEEREACWQAVRDADGRHDAMDAIRARQ